MALYEWIKFRKLLIRDGRIISIMRKTCASRAEVVGALVMLWSLADDYAEADGTLPGYSPEDIDREIGIENFCAALPVDWMQLKDGMVYLPNYQEHNGTTAKKRLEHQARARKQQFSCAFPAREAQQKRTKNKNKKENKKEIQSPPAPPLNFSSESQNRTPETFPAPSEAPPDRPEATAPIAPTLAALSAREFELTPEGLGQEFAFFYRGTSRRERDATLIAQVFEELIRLGAPPSQIRLHIRDPDRPRTQYLWQFLRKWETTSAFAARRLSPRELVEETRRLKEERCKNSSIGKSGTPPPLA